MADDDLAGIVARAIAESRDIGAVLTVRPDMTASAAMPSSPRLPTITTAKRIPTTQIMKSRPGNIPSHH